MNFCLQMRAPIEVFVLSHLSRSAVRAGMPRQPESCVIRTCRTLVRIYAIDAFLSSMHCFSEAFGSSCARGQLEQQSRQVTKRVHRANQTNKMSEHDCVTGFASFTSARRGSQHIPYWLSTSRGTKRQCCKSVHRRISKHSTQEIDGSSVALV